MTQAFNWSLLVLVCLMLFSEGEGWRRRRRCPVRNCSVSSWSAYSPCTVPCGAGGTKTRTRTKTSEPSCGGTCTNIFKETIACNRRCSNGGIALPGRCSCKTGYSGRCCTGVDGGWCPWSPWQPCSKTCGTGRRDRTRSCTSPTPSYGGKTCSGAARNEETCNTQRCPVDGGWGVWGSWSACDKSCGGGLRQRTRACTNPPPAFGGKGCGISNHETSSCKLGPCFVHGGWSQWGEWSPCNVTCGTGKRSRERLCNNPTPLGDGNPCVGDSTKYKPCATNKICLVEIGCYRNDPSLFPDLLEDFRGQIKWSSAKPFAKEMQRIVQKCASVARKKGLRMFAIENFGMCHGDMSQDYNFSNKTVSKRCSFGVGLANNCFVYICAA